MLNSIYCLLQDAVFSGETDNDETKTGKKARLFITLCGLLPASEPQDGHNVVQQSIWRHHDGPV